MNELEIFTAGLGLSTPWVVKEVVYRGDEPDIELHITVGCVAMTKFEYEGENYSIYDHQERTWRHLNFFEHKCYLHAQVPRIKTKNGNVLLVDVPWASVGSSFALMFEMMVIKQVQSGVSVSRVGANIDVNPGRIRRIIKAHVINALATQELESVIELSVDETSSKKGHNYLTILADRERKKVVGISEGKDGEALVKALEEMEFRGADRKDVRCVTMDMSVPYIAAVSQYMITSKIVFDRFHLAYNLNKAIDKIRVIEQGKFADLKRTKFLWLKNYENLKDEHKIIVDDLSKQYTQIGKAYRLKELFREVMDNAKNDSALKWLNLWMKEAWESEIPQIQNFVNMLRRHWYGIKTYFQELATNAFAERVNLKIQEIKRVAKGYRNIFNYKIMIYLHLGDLKIGDPL